MVGSLTFHGGHGSRTPMAHTENSTNSTNSTDMPDASSSQASSDFRDGSTSGSTCVRGRLAPSPTGYIHLGNAWSFLLCWLAVRSQGGTLVLRMEDIDPDRSRPEYVDGIMRDLAWLGLHWDEGPDVGGPYGPYVQSHRYARYEEVIRHLEEQGHIYPCYCTRKELRALASAPHAEDYGPAYPAICLNLTQAERAERAAQGRNAAMRLHCGDHAIGFHDVLRGDLCLTWEECGGDFAVRRSDGVFAYQLAVVIDDADQHITQIVRGDDILHCTPRQVLVYRLLGKPIPQYAHVPLVYDHEGERLAKRHQHFEIRMLRDAGVRPQAVIGYLAYRAGLQPEPVPALPEQFANCFRLKDIPLGRVQLEADIFSVLKSL